MLNDIKRDGDYYDDYPKHYLRKEHGKQYALINYIEMLEKENTALRREVIKLQKQCTTKKE